MSVNAGINWNVKIGIWIVYVFCVFIAAIVSIFVFFLDEKWKYEVKKETIVRCW